jgi:3-methyladenine DNA glycosylase AlkD
MTTTPDPLTAAHFIERLHAMQSDDELRKIQRYFKTGEGDYAAGDTFIGVRMGGVFELAKEFIDLPPDEIEVLLESDIHEVRAGAVSVMNKQASRKRTPAERRRELYELYLRRHDRINNWDLVDLGAQHVVGRYLADKPRDVLYQLAASEVLWERRTALYATFFFLRDGETQDALALADRLVEDPEELIQKAVGAVLRTVGGDELLAFLDRHAARMPRTMLTTAMEHLSPEQKAHYRSL